MKTEKLNLSERIERRLEMIHAHTKQGKTVRCVIEEFSVSVGTYYYWYHRYVKAGIFGLLNSILKRVPNPLISHCTVDIKIKRDESSQGTTFKKNDGEKENNSSSTQKGVKKVRKKHERSNVYTNPLTSPQRNQNDQIVEEK